MVKGFKPYFKSGRQSEIITITNLICHEQDLNLSSACVEENLKDQYQWIGNIQIIWIDFWFWWGEQANFWLVGRTSQYRLGGKSKES